MMTQSLHKEVTELMNSSLAADAAAADITSHYLLEKNGARRLKLVAEQPLVMAGGAPIVATHKSWCANIDMNANVADGTPVQEGEVLLLCHGDQRELMAVERSLLNLLHVACAIATSCHHLCAGLRDGKTQLWDTRKTLPMMRHLSKYAARMGGARNHRLNLQEGVFIKDNHIAACGGMAQTLALMKERGVTDFIIECDTEEDAKMAIDNNAPWIVLDNMDNAMMKRLVAYNKKRSHLEGSGGMTAARVRQLATMGLDGISVGSMTLFPEKVTITAHWSDS